MKFDGYRAQIAISGSNVVYTRNGHDWTRQFKVILPPLQRLTEGAVLIDGEIVAIDSQGRTNFSMLKTGIAAGMPLKFYAFDLLEFDGEDLSNQPLLERKAQLESLLGARRPRRVDRSARPAPEPQRPASVGRRGTGQLTGDWVRA
ncbi:hypothetical protein X730_30195 [Mesorhizobium sp. L103C565B0]|nr:hypothetical protein X730_30195 [Mesorhizobium sp. L103C565B0]